MLTGVALVQLTGSRSASTLDMTLPVEPAIGLRLTIASRAFRDEDASTILAEIAEGRATRWLLPWIPLMRGGGKPTMVEEWVRLAHLEPDNRSRSNYAALALIFAELTRHKALWKKRLEGWNVRESMIVNEWKAEGKAEGELKASREILFDLLRARFPDEVRGDLAASITAESDRGKLMKGISLMIKVGSIEEFRAVSGF